MGDIYRVFHPTNRQYTFFSTAHGTFCKIDTLRHKAKLNKFKKIEIIPCIISDHNTIKLDLNNNNKNSGKY
jgi:cobalamin biosynthesis Co2+ chelatase CbiK